MTELPDELRALLNMARDAHDPTDPEARTRVRGAIAASVLISSGAATSSVFPQAAASNTQTLGTSLHASKASWALFGSKLSTLAVGAVAAAGLSLAAYGYSKQAAPAVQPTTSAVLQHVAPAHSEASPEREAVAPAALPPSLPDTRSGSAAPELPARAERASGTRKPLHGSDSMAAETALLRSASQALARGDESAAIALLREHGRRFPAGSLREEREGLRAIAECSVDDASRSVRAQTARRFMHQYPGSLLGARVTKACPSE
ncbi:MAG: hypothetical protein JWN48_4217 [Myxococcaceae bacterium]|nr:hypothetical protein [Myxococcaceae bacterium]